MNRLLRTELLKLRTTRTTALVIVSALAVAALLGMANAAVAGDPGAPDLGSASWVVGVLGVSTIPAGVALLLGVLLSAGEHQHHTITTTFLVTPRRGRVVLAKALAAAVAGPAVAAGMVAVAAAATVPFVLAEGVDVDTVHRDAALAVVGVLGASALLGALGVLLGLLLRSQVATLVLVLGWFVVVEGVASVLTGGAIRRWLPASAAADLAGNAGQAMWAAALVLAAWTAAAALVTAPTVARRDVG